MPTHKTCDGITRRDALKAGLMGGVGVTLSDYLRLSAAGQVRQNAPAKHGIFIHLQGGPSQLDTFDMKPDAPREFRGTFDPIDTNIPGVSFCEHLPKLAQCADKFALLRGVSHTLGAHALGTEYISTGTRPLPTLDFPVYGSVVGKETERLNPEDLPQFVASNIVRGYQRPGYLGIEYAPMFVGAPREGRPFRVRGVSMNSRQSVAGFNNRRGLLNDLDRRFSAIESEDELLNGLDRFGQQAHSIITSPRTSTAFDISRESPAFAKPFGNQPFGMSCLLATRLIESGVRFVSLEFGDWDTHEDNFTRLKDLLLPRLDVGLSALFTGLAEKGLLESTAVFVTGEFGRTPRINSRTAEGGRDHYPRCMFMLLAGGGIQGGQVVGASDDRAAFPANEDEAFTPDDAAATFYHALGIDHTREYQTSIGRPITIVRDGTVIRQLFT